jgi:transcriptional regulator with XRE-family HTH domain
MMTIAQSRAARGLLGWTQNDLAIACGLSKTAINNFEKGHSNIKSESLASIRNALMHAGIEFLEDEGVRKQKDRVRLTNSNYVLLDDIIDTIVYNPDAEVLLRGFKTGLDNLIKNNDQEKYHLNLKKIKARTRSIDSNNAIGLIIYGPKVALCMADESATIIIDSAEIAAREQNRFEDLWTLQNLKTKNIRAATNI